MELGFKIVKSAPVWAGFGALRKPGLVQNQIIERVVYSNTLSMKWFSYCSKRHSNSFLVSLCSSDIGSITAMNSRICVELIFTLKIRILVAIFQMTFSPAVYRVHCPLILFCGFFWKSIAYILQCGSYLPTLEGNGFIAPS